MKTTISRRNLLGTAAAAAGAITIARLDAAWRRLIGTGPRPRRRPAEPRPRLLFDARVHARPGARDGEDARRDVDDVQGRAHPAHRSAGDDARDRRQDQGGRHHDHGRRHDHPAQRPGADQKGLRIREERRLPPDLRRSRSRRARHHRADGEDLRHQGRHPQPRARGKALAASAGRLRRGEVARQAARPLHRRRPHAPHRAPIRCRRAASAATASTTCT